MKRGHLYFLQVEPFGPVKIGWTGGEVHLRVKQLQQASPHVLRWIGAVERDRKAETEAHRVLASDRLRNEWFNPTPAVMAFITRTIGSFDEKAYVELHFRPSLQSRFRKLVAYRRDFREHLLSRIGFKFDDNRWLERGLTLSQEQLDKIESVVSAAERGEINLFVKVADVS